MHTKLCLMAACGAFLPLHFGRGHSRLPSLWSLWRIHYAQEYDSVEAHRLLTKRGAQITRGTIQPFLCFVLH